MKTITVVRLLLTVLLVLSGYSASPEATDRPVENSLRVVQSSEQEIVLELTVTDFQMQMTEHEGQTAVSYTHLTLPTNREV